jgi:phage-related protein
MDRIREIVYFGNYFTEFFESQKEEVKEKIDFVLFLVCTVERIPGKFFRNIKGEQGLYEIRVEFDSDIYRIFCCFDEGKIVVLFNGFQKKSQKAPKKEIKKAVRIKNEYFYLKNKLNTNEKR